jgi:hypothetical protein
VAEQSGWSVLWRRPEFPNEMSAHETSMASIQLPIFLPTREFCLSPPPVLLLQSPGRVSPERQLVPGFTRPRIKKDRAEGGESGEEVPQLSFAVRFHGGRSGEEAMKPSEWLARSKAGGEVSSARQEEKERPQAGERPFSCPLRSSDRQDPHGPLLATSLCFLRRDWTTWGLRSFGVT